MNGLPIEGKANKGQRLEDNKSVISQIRNGDQKVLETIYLTYRDEFIVWLNKYYKSDFEEASDVFQQLMIQFYENIISGRLEVLTSNIKTYLFGIGKNKIRELRESSSRTLNLVLPTEEPTEQVLWKEMKLERVEKALEEIGEACKRLLDLYYYHKKNMEEITLLLGYKNPATTKNLKYKCLGRLRKIYANIA